MYMCIAYYMVNTRYIHVYCILYGQYTLIRLGVYDYQRERGYHWCQGAWIVLYVCHIRASDRVLLLLMWAISHEHVYLAQPPLEVLQRATMRSMKVARTDRVG
jgi:hypothetical protein